QKRGNLENITQKLGGITLDKKLNFMSKNRPLYPQLKPQSNYDCIQQVERQLESLYLTYIPTAKIKDIYPQLQVGDIIGVVTNIAGLDTTHTGLVYRFPDGKIGLIHASPAGQVTIAKDLQKYISKVDKAIGIFVVRPLDPRNN
ncbi:MAG: N-acetylmuramoyl-L-alanine amidase-like domain-containing protein, partial [Microcystis panniformis]